MIRHHREALASGTLVLLGDVFDQFVEYRHLMPKHAPRLVGAVAELADAGAEVVYLRGNRDPWHLDVFEGLGVDVRDTWEAGRYGLRLFAAHGDGHAPMGRKERLAGRLQPLLRAPPVARLYRMALPGDAAFGLARWVARRFGTDGAPDPAVAHALEGAAKRRLAHTDADLVAFGHSHTAALQVTADGTYLNPGYFFGARTFATLGPEGPALWCWRSGTAHRFERLTVGTAARSGAIL